MGARVTETGGERGRQLRAVVVGVLVVSQSVADWRRGWHQVPLVDWLSPCSVELEHAPAVLVQVLARS